MEKVIIKTATKKEYNGRAFVTIELQDGRQGSSNDLSMESMVGELIDVDVKLAKEYNGVQQYYFNLPKQPKQSGGKFAKDMTFEKRRVALECAVRYLQGEPNKTSVRTLEVAEKFLKWLE
jgi:hypothetical protein